MKKTLQKMPTKPQKTSKEIAKRLINKLTIKMKSTMKKISKLKTTMKKQRVKKILKTLITSQLLATQITLKIIKIYPKVMKNLNLQRTNYYLKSCKMIITNNQQI